MKLKTKINIYFLTAYFIISTISFYLIGLETVQSVNSHAIDEIDNINKIRAEHVSTYLNSEKEVVSILAASNVFRDFLKLRPSDIKYKTEKDRSLARLDRSIISVFQINELFIIGKDGKVIISTDRSQDGIDKNKEQYFINGKLKVYVSDFYYSDIVNKISYAVSAPIFDDVTKELLGVVVARMNTENFYNIVGSNVSLGSTGETFLVNRNKFFISPSRFLGPEAVLKEKADTQNVADCFQDSLNPSDSDIHGVMKYIDYRGISIYGTHEYIPQADWCIVTKIDVSEVSIPSYQILYIYIISAVLSLLIFYLISNIISKSVTDPINNLLLGTEKIKEGDFDVNLDIKNNDEIGVLSNSFMLMVNDVKKSRNEIEGKVKEQTKDLTDQKNAMLNLLEDSKQLEEELKNEKKSVDAKIAERTMELIEEKSKLLASIEALLKAYIMIDLKGNIILTNHNLSELFGNVTGNWTLDKLQAKFGSSFDITESYKKCLETKKRLIYKEQPFGVKFLEIRISPVFEDKTQKKLIGVLAIIGDITEEKILARSRDEFFSIASHELRTPLTAIKGNASMILDYYKEQIKDPDLKEMLDDIHESSCRLIGIVNDFLNLSRLEQGRLEFKMEETDIIPVIQDVIKEYQGQVASQNIYLKFDESKEKIPQILVDSERFRQILTNLIGNALKYTKTGGITIATELQKDSLNIKVSDTGSGIPLKNQSLLFHKFQQASSSILTRDTAHGTGLGLYISKLMIEGMGGSIWLEKSVDGVGSTFAFSIPVANKDVMDDNKKD